MKNNKDKKIPLSLVVKICCAVVGLITLIVCIIPEVRNSFGYFYIVAVVGALLFATSIALMLPKRNAVHLDSWYARKKTLMSPCEYEFYQLLCGIRPEKYTVLPQMALVSVIDKVTNNSYRNELFRIADYCFVDKTTFAPLLLVELNDSSHLRADRVERDEKVNAICAAAGLPLLTFWTKDDNTFDSVRRAVERNILKS